MKIVILTTNTPHHIFFVKELSKNYKLSKIIVETSSIKPGFDTFHHFEKIRNDYESETLLKNKKTRFVDFASAEFYESVNQRKCVDEINSVGPDVVITFGTGKIKNDLINICPNGFLL